jgi:hypothetical protein
MIYEKIQKERKEIKMGFHICSKPENGFVHKKTESEYMSTSSADHELTFLSGNRWRMPTAILYYIHDCGWQPHDAFIEDLMQHDLAQPATHRQTRGNFNAGASNSEVRNIGYLDDEYVRLQLPPKRWTSKYKREDIVAKLEMYLNAEDCLTFQTKGFQPKI